jgi:hypothetical protein
LEALETRVDCAGVKNTSRVFPAFGFVGGFVLVGLVGLALAEATSWTPPSEKSVSESSLSLLLWISSSILYKIRFVDLRFDLR